MRKIFITNGVKENLDLRALISIIRKIRMKESREIGNEIDGFQVFEFKKNQMKNIQEFPNQIDVVELDYEIKDCNIWAVIGLDKNIGEYWTIMYPNEY